MLKVNYDLAAFKTAFVAEQQLSSLEFYYVHVNIISSYDLYLFPSLLYDMEVLCLFLIKNEYFLCDVSDVRSTLTNDGLVDCAPSGTPY